MKPLSDKQQAAITALVGAIGTGALYVVANPTQQPVVLAAGAVATACLTLKEALGSQPSPQTQTPPPKT
jgi:hypothetical protein